MVTACSGRQYYEEIVPSGSESNKCPLGLAKQCEKCEFYGEFTEA